MEQRIILDPALGLSPTQLAAAWNANPTTATHGLAQVRATPPGHFMGANDLGYLIIGGLSGISLNLLSSYLYDLIKAALAGNNKAAPSKITLQQIDQSDGSKITVVTVE